MNLWSLTHVSFLTIFWVWIIDCEGPIVGSSTAAGAELLSGNALFFFPHPDQKGSINGPESKQKSFGKVLTIARHINMWLQQWKKAEEHNKHQKASSSRPPLLLLEKIAAGANLCAPLATVVVAELEPFVSRLAVTAAAWWRDSSLERGEQMSTI